MGRRLFFLLVDVDVEFFAVALVFPVGDFVADTEKVRIATKIEIADEHPAEMTDVTDFIAAEAKRTQKSDGRHSGHNPFHLDRNGDRNDVGAAIWKENGAGDEDSENGAGRTNGGDKRVLTAPEHRKRFD